MKLSDIKTVTAKIEQGAWVKDLPNLDGVAVKVRGYGNSDYRRLLAKIRASSGTIDVDKQDAIDTRLILETILVDWSGIDDAPSYDAAVANTLLTDPELAVFRMAVNYAASVVAKQGADSLEGAAKN